jgi:hypothetical protein
MINYDYISKVERELNRTIETLEAKTDRTNREQLIEEILTMPSGLNMEVEMGIILWYEENDFPLEKLLENMKQTRKILGI